MNERNKPNTLMQVKEERVQKKVKQKSIRTIHLGEKHRVTKHRSPVPLVCHLMHPLPGQGAPRNRGWQTKKRSGVTRPYHLTQLQPGQGAPFTLWAKSSWAMHTRSCFWHAHFYNDQLYSLSEFIISVGWVGMHLYRYMSFFVASSRMIRWHLNSQTCSM